MYWRIIGGVGAVGLVLFVGWRLYENGYDAGQQAEFALRQEALAEAEKLKNEAEASWQQRVAELEMLLGAKIETVREVTNVIREEIPVFITEEVNSACTLPNGFVWLHDAAASGRPVAELPIRSGEFDGAAGGIELSDTAELLNDNYGVCRRNAIRLQEFQQYAKEVEDWWLDYTQSFGGEE